MSVHGNAKKLSKLHIASLVWEKLLMRLTNVENYHTKFYFHAHLEALLLYLLPTLNDLEQ